MNTAPKVPRTGVRARRISVSALVDVHELSGFAVAMVCTRADVAGAIRWLSAKFGAPVEPGVGKVHQGSDGTLILGVGPGRWLVRGMAARPDTGAPRNVALFDVTDVWRVFQLGGIAARRLLASGCPLDFEPRKFAPLRCAVSRFDECRVILCCTTEDTYEMYVERSYAEDLRARMVLRAAGMAAPAELEP